MKKSVKVIKLVSVVLFLFVLVLPSAFYYTVGENTDSNWLINEKRTLSSFPTAVDESFTDSFDIWYADHMPYRITMITLQKTFSQSYSAPYRKYVNEPLGNALAPQWYKEKGTDTPYSNPVTDNLAIYGKEDWLFFTGDETLTYYEGTNVMSEETSAFYCGIYEDLKEICDKKGIKLCIAIAPNKERMYSEYMPTYDVKSESGREIAFENYVAENSELNFDFLNDTLEKSEYTTYYKQDTHWNKVGGYLGYSRMKQMIGLESEPLQSLNVKKVIKKGGDLSEFCGYSTEYEDYEIEYKPEVSYTVDRYLEYHDRSFEKYYVEVFNSTSENESKIVFLGDSFRNSAKEFIAKDFSKATVAHRTYWEFGEVQKSLKELGEGDVLMLLAVERYDYLNVDIAKKLCDFWNEE